MPARSKVSGLPNDVRAWLEQVLVQNRFGGYTALADELKARGYTISKSALGRFGLKFERRLQALRDATDAARQIAEYAADDNDDRSASVIGMIQADVFHILVELQDAESQDDPAERLKLRARAAKAMAELSRASINQKKWRTQVAAKAEAAARQATAIARKGGLTAAAVDELRRTVLEIAA